MLLPASESRIRRIYTCILKSECFGKCYATFLRHLVVQMKIISKAPFSPVVPLVLPFDLSFYTSFVYLLSLSIYLSIIYLFVHSFSFSSSVSSSIILLFFNSLSVDCSFHLYVSSDHSIHCLFICCFFQ